MQQTLGQLIGAVASVVVMHTVAKRIQNHYLRKTAFADFVSTHPEYVIEKMKTPA